MSAKGLFTRLKLRNLLRRNGSRLLDTDITLVSYPTKFLRDFKQYQTPPFSLLNILIRLKLATAFSLIYRDLHRRFIPELQQRKSC